VEATASATEVDRRTIEIVRAVCEAVRLPVAVKIAPYHSNLLLFAQQVVAAGARGLVLFNRFLQPDLDVERMRVRYTVPLSTPGDLLLPLTWTMILRNRIQASIAASGGVHDAVAAVKLLAAGADAVQVASVLLQRGPKHLLQLCRDFEDWMDKHEMSSVESLQRVMSYGAGENSETLERSGYVAAVTGWPHRGSPKRSELDEEAM
jgi:dihydroorotate dehydrogenase (fumarate)